ncbi:MAG: rRNA (adenine1518-N6/adenine1519-N6)-dimethyltransferase [Acidobacteriota bacterium]|jgi:16S rRNA (adenine1518-N6/adenine1519-N6)-dimethyltransferase|nr:rRNA (adenine1518-N6/adenine1519-N6)-dimethyltransferase [Acidobacteriota bacterium]
MRDEVKKKRAPSIPHASSFIPHPSSLIPSSLPPKKHFGQNFLADERIIERIVQEVRPRAAETIVEIGAGHGALTSRLIDGSGRLFAIEFDRDLIPLLNEKFGAHENFTLIEGDALAVDLCAIIAPTAQQARVVANLPYYISTAILQRLIEQRACLTEMVLMLQREVVARVTAPPASSERGFLSVLVEAYCETETLFDVPPTAFRPIPKVWSTVVRLRVRQQPTVDVGDEHLFRRIVSAGFAQRRKTIFNNLRSAPADLYSQVEKAGGAERALESAGIEARRRAETLTLEEWGTLARVLEGV